MRPGIARVVVGTIDPDPAGRRVSGIELLRRRRASTWRSASRRRRARAARALYVAARDGPSVRGRQDREHARRRRRDGRRHESVDHGRRGSPRRARAARPEPGGPRRRRHRARSDDPALTARLGRHRARTPARGARHTRPKGAKVRPCLELSGDLGLSPRRDRATTTSSKCWSRAVRRPTSAFFDAGLVNHVVWYQAAAFAGSDGTLGAPKASRPRRSRRFGAVDWSTCVESATIFG